MMKKLSVGAYLACVAAVAGLVGCIAMVRSSGIATAYKYSGLSTMILAAVCGIVLALVSVYTPTKFGNHDYISTFAGVGAVALFSFCVGQMISQRILLAAGLFSYNSQNAVGWSVFYATVVSIVAFLVAILLVIVGEFLPSVKKNA